MDIKAIASRCLNCKNKPCQKGCPANMDVPSFIQAILSNDLDLAYHIMRNTHPFPSICGRVCYHLQQCEGACTLNKFDKPVEIGKLEQYVGDHFLESNPLHVSLKNKGKVAIVGSGPAGLSCAYYLLSNDYKVSIYEKEDNPGGILYYGIPSYRLDKDIVNKYVSEIQKMGCVIKCNTQVGKDITIAKLKQDNDIVFLVSGLSNYRKLHIPNEDLKNVFSAYEFLKHYNSKNDGSFVNNIRQLKNVCVVGGGNVAIDTARCLKRLNVANVSIIYRRDFKHIRAIKEDVSSASNEGINFYMLCNPISVIGNDKIEQLKLTKMELVIDSITNKSQVYPIIGSEFTIPCDGLFEAIGAYSNNSILDGLQSIKVANDGLIIVDDKYHTSVDSIMAAGDITTGALTVVSALKNGYNAAKEMMEIIDRKGELNG